MASMSNAYQPIPSEYEESLIRSQLKGTEAPLFAHWEYYWRLLKGTGRSASTIINTRNSLRLFLCHSNLISLEAWKDGKSVQETFLRLKQERNWSDSTYNTYRKGMGSYFHVLSNAGLINDNPIARVEKCPDIPHDQPKFENDQI